MKRELALTRIVAGSCVVLTLIAAGCGKRDAGDNASRSHGPAISATLETVSKNAIAVPYEAVGTVRSRTVSTIESRIVGQVTAVHVKEGDTVEPGTLLVEVDDRETVTQTQKAESGLTEAHKALTEAEKAVTAAREAQTAAEASRALADATFQRIKNLADSQAASRQALDEAEAKQKAAAAQAAQAGEILKSYQAKKEEAAARIEQAKAGAANAQVFLSYTKIISPITGVVTMKKVDVGDLAAPGAPLLEIEDTGQYRLEATVDEGQVGRLHGGDPAPVVIDALGGAEIAGTVAEIVPAADPASRTFTVKVDLPPTESLRSGMFGRARFAAGQRQVLTVPATAVVDRGQLTGVYVVDAENTVRLRLIKTGKQFGGRVEVLSGLNEGEIVVVDNLDRVSDGVRIERS